MDQEALAAIGKATGGSGGQNAGGHNGGQENQQDQKARQESQELERRNILDQILEPAARDRLSTIGIVKPERARAIGDLLIQNAKQGRLRGPVNESLLRDLLNQVEENERKRDNSSGKIVFQRKNASDSDEDLIQSLGGPSTYKNPNNKADDSDDEFDL